MSDGCPISRSLYLRKGAPGTGNTTIRLQFLLEGAGRGEANLIQGLSEARGQLNALATSFGWNLTGIDIHDLGRRGKRNTKLSSYTVSSPSEVELEEISARYSNRSTG